MTPFAYTRVTVRGEAVRQVAADPAAAFLAGGTNLVDEMKLYVRSPAKLVDVLRVDGLDAIEDLPDGGLRVGTLVTNSKLAWDDRVAKRYPAVSQALLAGASGQLRNRATTGGNLLQRTRCYYYRDPTYAECNKRTPGSGCAALGGYHMIHAVLGTSDQCFATHPSDFAVAVMAVGGTVRTSGPNGERAIPIDDFYVAYGDDPAKENVLQHGELITHLDLPAAPWARRSTYLKVRDRASYAFALSSAAVALEVEGDAIKTARVALGGLATKPWRSPEAEATLVGKPATAETFKAAGEAALRGAVPRKDNAFKVELGKRTVARALANALKMEA